jgi:DNA invertase Pin-like site-specific DNA recombinase
MSTLLLSVMGAFAEFERALIRERQREGIDLAKKRGAYKGRVPSLNPEQIIIIKQQLAIGVPKAKLSREFNVSRQTIYSLLK